MEPRARVLNTLKRKEKPDRVPFEISFGAFTPRLMKVYKEKTGSASPPEEYYNFDTRNVFPDKSIQETDFAGFFEKEIKSEATFNEWGIGMMPTIYEIPDYCYHPLAGLNTVNQINDYPWPDLGNDYRYVEVAKKVKEYHDRGYPVNGEMYQTIYETAWLMRGLEQMMFDFFENEEVAHTIFENMTLIRIQQAINFAKAGVDIIRIGDDIVSQQANLLGSDIFDKFFKWRYKKIVKAAKEINPDILIFYHSCGKVEGVIDDLIDIGIDILNPLQPECNNLKMINDKYKSKLSFWGGIGVQSVMPHGNPDEVRARVKETINILGKEGGYLIAPAHILDPSVPWENVIAFIDAVRHQL